MLKWIFLERYTYERTKLPPKYVKQLRIKKASGKCSRNSERKAASVILVLIILTHAYITHYEIFIFYYRKADRLEQFKRKFNVHGTYPNRTLL
jgi:hypothetical protein